MAKIIVFEGIERCSKSTMIDMLDGQYGKKMDPGKKQPEHIKFEDLGVLYEGMHQFAEKFFKLVDDTFLIDRFFASEFVYSDHFDRRTCMTIDYVKELCDNNEVHMFYMENTHRDYINRGPKNKIKLSDIDWLNMQNLFENYIRLFEDQVPKLNIHRINTTNKDIQEIYEEITAILNEK
jgi:thymidylate kinase